VQSPHLIVYALTAWFLLSMVYRLIMGARRKPLKFAEGESKERAALPALVMSAAMIMMSSSILLGGRMFLSGQLLTAFRAMAGTLLAVSLVDAVLALWRPKAAKLDPKKLITPALSLVVGGYFLAMALYLHSVPGSNSVALFVEVPVRGAWEAASGGRSPRTNFHHGNPDAQSYAVDFVRVGGASEGEPVFAPVGGVVSQATNHRVHGGQMAEGNVIVIKAADGVEVWLAHLQKGSVLVEEGDSVEAGQEIAKCGQTGSAARPHLHIHAQRGDAPVPLLFGEDNRFLVRGDIIKTEN
jgi:murein DD-endopeptidase MepM/ murein hydrolase activator NlpD